jgi:predicted lysophospholipase L1 biosynthesis ABC-type transport system permease subunit
MNALGLLTFALAVVYFAAAFLHTGGTIPLVPVTFEASQPASIAETIIGIALSVAAVMVLRTGPSRAVWALYVFALAFTLLGFTIILLAGQGGPDLWVHFIMLGGLAACFALLFFSARGRPRSI